MKNINTSPNTSTAHSSPLTAHHSFLLALYSLLLFTFNSFAAIHEVKHDGTGDFTQIQAAIDAASVNDTILVWPGTYYENISFEGKDLVLASLFLTTGDRQYISQTIIDGNKNGSVITLEDGETLASVICGFTIQNGKKDFSSADWDKSGSGVMLYYSFAKIENNIIKNNLAYGGGGVCCLEGRSILKGNTICYNHAYYWGGGVFSSSEEHPVLFDTSDLNNIYLNTANTGCDIVLKSLGEPQLVKLDTLTVFTPGLHFVYCSDGYSNPVNELTLEVQHQKIVPVATDLYVSPSGSNSNTGLSPESPLKSLSFAMLKIQPDSLQQHTIHLMPGTYSPETTDERLPIGGRSNIRISGESMENTIIDCQLEGYFYSGWLLENIAVENLTTVNGFGAILSPTSATIGGLETIFVKKVKVNNFTMSNFKHFNSQCIQCNYPDSVWLSNYKCLNGVGMQANFFVRTMDDFPMYLRMENTKISGNRYLGGDDLFGGFQNLSLVGGLNNNEIVSGKLINAEITDNVSWDTWFSNTNGAGFGTSRRAKLDVVNATIGGNRDSTNLPGTNNTVEGSTLNIYNSIFYDNNSPDIYVLGIEGYDPATINFYYTLIENGSAGIMDGAGNTTLNWGMGNRSDVPLWENYGSNPYALTAASPCIDAGTPMFEEGLEPPYIKTENGKYILYKHDMDTVHLPATDLAGNPRIAYGRIDMGAYEFADSTIGLWPKPKHLSFKPSVQPNPFSENTRIRFAMLTAGHCRVEVFDMQGRSVKTLLDTQTQAGSFDIRWQGNNDVGMSLPQGYYIISIAINGQQAGSVKVKKM